jgi:23S rRNA-/tRNA-specific pseudouridylate synthase
VKGKTAQTNYRVLASSATHRLLMLMPETGRTHQLRVHLAYIGTPIHGDKVYGTPADRMYLHAYKLEVTIPDGDRRVFEAPVPPEFTTEFPEAKL